MKEDELTLPIFDAEGNHIGYRLTPKGVAVLHCPTCQCNKFHHPADAGEPEQPQLASEYAD